MEDDSPSARNRRTPSVAAVLAITIAVPGLMFAALLWGAAHYLGLNPLYGPSDQIVGTVTSIEDGVDGCYAHAAFEGGGAYEAVSEDADGRNCDLKPGDKVQVRLDVDHPENAIAGYGGHPITGFAKKIAYLIGMLSIGAGVIRYIRHRLLVAAVAAEGSDAATARDLQIAREREGGIEDRLVRSATRASEVLTRARIGARDAMERVREARETGTSVGTVKATNRRGRIRDRRDALREQALLELNSRAGDSVATSAAELAADVDAWLLDGSAQAHPGPTSPTESADVLSADRSRSATATSMVVIMPGWYPTESGTGERFHDGEQWTNHTRPRSSK